MKRVKPSIYGCTFCMLLFDFVCYVLLLCLYILIVMYVLLRIFCFHRVVLCTVCVEMGVNPTAVSKYILSYVSITLIIVQGTRSIFSCGQSAN
jgi:hypothetical protein